MSELNPAPNAMHASQASIVFGEPFSELNRFVLSITEPNLSITLEQIATPNPNPFPMRGNRINRTDLIVEFLIDENMISYGLIRDWFNLIKHENEAGGEQMFAEPTIVDINVPIFNSCRKEVANFRYASAFPNTIPANVWTYNDSTNNPMTMSIPFSCHFTHFSRTNIEDPDYRIPSP